MTFKEKKKSSLGLLFGLLIIIIILAVGYLYLSPAFEQNKPQIKIADKIYWNLKSKLTVDFEDESGIKYYKITFKDGKRNIVLNQEVISSNQKNLSIDIVPPKLDMFYKGDKAVLEIEVVDNSKWNFLEGNKALKKVNIILDTKKPVANVLSNSRYIQRGGSAVVVVEVSDDNLEDMYISFNGKKKFKLMPYKTKNYFVALVAWPIDIEEFNRVNLVVLDKAKNKRITKVPFYIQKKKIKTDDIELNKNFIKNVSAFVLEQSGEAVPNDVGEIFVYSNTHLRDKNIEQLEKTALNSMKDKVIEEFKIKPFRRLRGSKTVAGYGERRHYFLDGQEINQAWHLGVDWASVKKAPIKTSNSGEVVFKNYLGLYGNSIIIDHGMGLFSLYAHTSTQKVEVGDIVKAKEVIANTGSTGAVFGDHLHFGILIQGVEVNPLEWMDKNWIKVRITNVLNDANKQISGK